LRALRLKIYSTPLVKFKVGFSTPFIIYLPLACVTLKIFDGVGVGVGVGVGLSPWGWS
jgi:hypothetical protein